MLGTTGKSIGIACTVVAALAVSIAPAASAKGGDGTRVAGVCSGQSTSLLKIKARDGRLEIAFEVDQNRNRVPWNVQLLRNGKLAFAGTRTTVAPSGSFSLERKLAAGGAPVIRARASRNGELCTATLTAPRATAAGGCGHRSGGERERRQAARRRHGRRQPGRRRSRTGRLRRSPRRQLRLRRPGRRPQRTRWRRRCRRQRASRQRRLGPAHIDSRYGPSAGRAPRPARTHPFGGDPVLGVDISTRERTGRRAATKVLRRVSPRPPRAEDARRPSGSERTTPHDEQRCPHVW